MMGHNLVPVAILLALAASWAACGARSEPPPALAPEGGAVSIPAPFEPALAPPEAAVPPSPEAFAAPVAPAAAPAAPVLTPPAIAGSPRTLAMAKAPPEVAALAALVLDEDSATVLFEKDAHRPLPPASLTKIATAILVIEHGDLDREVESDVDSTVMRGSSVMGLLPGDRFSVRELLYGLMLPSGNDAALALARATSGSDAKFVDAMNALVARLGLADTHFTNPHGLSGRGHTSSAYDLAILARYAMNIPEFQEIAAARSVTVDGSRKLTLRNSNTFVGSYRGADGVKIGYTRSAGHTLVASAVRDGRRLYAVVLNSTDRNGDAAKLLDWAFASHAWPEK